MPNSFLGFPVRRAMLADYALKSEALSDLYAGIGLYYQTYFESLDAFWTSSSPADGVSISQNNIALSTQGGGTDFASLYKSPDTWTTQLSWAKQAKFKADVLFNANTDSLPKMDLLWGREDNYQHVGFVVRAGDLKGSVANGSAETLTAALLSWGAAGYYEAHKLEVIYKITSCEFWVDGALAATIATGLPAGTAYAHWLLRAYVRANASTNYHGLLLSFFKAWKQI